MRRLIVLTVVAVLGVTVAACGLPSDDKFTEIDEAEDGFGLSRPSTTTTSTTLAPTTTIDATTSTSIELTTTTSIPVEQVDMYFPIGRQLAKIQVPLPADPVLNQVMARILQGPPEGESFVGLRTILPADAEVTATNEKGVAVVDFPAGIFEDISASDQRLVFGQIVLTMTSQPGIGQVRFTQEQQDISVFLGDASSSVAGQPVTRDDYKNLASGVDPIEPTTTTTTTAPAVDPTVTAPPDG